MTDIPVIEISNGFNIVTVSGFVVSMSGIPDANASGLYIFFDGTNLVWG
jgi:hypothetical protein